MYFRPSDSVRVFLPLAVLAFCHAGCGGGGSGSGTTASGSQAPSVPFAGNVAPTITGDAAAYEKIWDNFGAVLKEGLYNDFERRDALLSLARFRTTSSTDTSRSLKGYVASLKENQTSIYYLTGEDMTRLEASPHLEGFRARGIEVLLLPDPVDSFWTGTGVAFDGKPFKSVTQGTADLALIPKIGAKDEPTPDLGKAVTDFVSFVKESLGDAVSDVRVSERLTDSAVCLVAPEKGPDRQLEKMLMDTGRLKTAAKPILEINPRHDIVVALSALGDEDRSFKSDAAHLLLDQARIFDGEQPENAKGFGERMARVLRAGVANRKPASAA